MRWLLLALALGGCATGQCNEAVSKYDWWTGTCVRFGESPPTLRPEVRPGSILAPVYIEKR